MPSDVAGYGTKVTPLVALETKDGLLNFSELFQGPFWQVDPEGFSWDVSGCLASCVQSFTKADHHRMLLPRPVPLLPDVFYKISADIRVWTAKLFHSHFQKS